MIIKEEESENKNKNDVMNNSIWNVAVKTKNNNNNKREELDGYIEETREKCYMSLLSLALLSSSFYVIVYYYIRTYYVYRKDISDCYVRCISKKVI